MSVLADRMAAKLALLYGAEQAPRLLDRLLALINSADEHTPPTVLPLSEKDVILITYGDQVRRGAENPLAVLHHVLKQTVQNLVNTVHILPFYPYSSDDGFSVIDYYAVDPALGDWGDIQRLRQDFKLMFDAVFNHVSVSSAWFQAFLRGEAPYDRYFVTADPTADLSLVRRPRALPLLTPFQTAQGEKWVWTTFSADQVDVDVNNPDVLLELIAVLLFYVRQGADFIRLDAIAYLWKTIGTDCIHLPQTHLVVQLMRDVLDWVAPQVQIITETNVPHAENISYFGDGSNEAQMVYQFSLPPLVLHTFRLGDVTALNHWATSVQLFSPRTTYFNFTASHDGIGVTPALGLLSEADTAALVGLAEDHGGYVSYKNNPDGSRSPYELNITYFDAINPPALTAADPQQAVARFIASQAILLAFLGVPGIYFHSLFGSRNWRAGVQETGRYRTINRQKLEAETLLAELQDAASLRASVYHRYRALLAARIKEPAFHPLGSQRVLEMGAGVFALERIAPDGEHQVLALHHVRGETVEINLPEARRWRDLLTGEVVEDRRLRLLPYQAAWLKAL